MEKEVIDVDDYLKDKNNTRETEENFELNQKYENNYDLKVSLLNVDSKYRNIVPKNVVETVSEFLENDPIEITKNSFEVKIYKKNHTFNEGEQIILQNIKYKKIILQGNFYLLQNFKYCLINIDNHEIDTTESINEFDFDIFIKPYSEINNNNSRLIGNIPINSIFGIHKVKLLDELDISESVFTNLLKNVNLNKEEINKNFIFIELPFEYSKENRLGNDIIFSEFYNLNLILSCEFLNIGGIPIKFLNANYPINYTQNQYSHVITRTDQDYIYFNSNVKGNFNDKGGGDNVYIAKIIKSIEGYPNQNNYVLDLKKNFTDVVRIELVSSEIPYIEYNVLETINNKNNTIYWKHFEDGDHIYQAVVDSGYYSQSSLAEALSSKMNNVLRINSTVENLIYNSFDIKINSNSQTCNIFAYKLDNLPNSLTISRDDNYGNSIKLSIRHPNNFVQVGDIITISNSRSIGDINHTAINDSHTVFSVNNYSNTYTVLIPFDLNDDEGLVNIEGNGGNLVTVRTPAKVSFLFDRENTIGDIIGFKYTGEKLAVTNFQHKTSNTDGYIFPFNLDITGNKIISNPIIKLSGEYYYLFMYLNDFEGVLSNTNTLVDNAFAKIILSGTSGSIMFNTFINSPLEFQTPIPSLNELNIKFLYPDGTKPDFKNFEHSFTLRITEKVTRPVRTGIISRKENYTSALIERYVLDKDLNENKF